MNNLCSLDIVEIDIDTDNSLDLSTFMEHIKRAPFGIVTVKRINDAAMKIGYHIEDSLTDIFFLKKGRNKITFNKTSKEVHFEQDNVKAYAIVVPVGNHPFLFFYDGFKPTLASYDMFVDEISAVYRHSSTYDELFVLSATNHLVYPDMYDALSNKECIYSMARTMNGNPCLNYVYTIFSMLGVDFPASYEDGTDVNMLANCLHGFERIK